VIPPHRDGHGVLVATEDAAMNSLLRSWIDGQPGLLHCLATCRGVEEAVKAARILQPASIVVSYRLQDGMGTMAVRLVRQSNPKVGTVIIVGDRETGGSSTIALRPAQVLKWGSLSCSALRDAVFQSISFSR
jgi:ActR/RegA family two-component response regulator